jgi:hypothetical protein
MPMATQGIQTIAVSSMTTNVLVQCVDGDQRNDDNGDGIADRADALPGPEQAEVPLPQQPAASAGRRRAADRAGLTSSHIAGGSEFTHARQPYRDS